MKINTRLMSLVTGNGTLQLTLNVSLHDTRLLKVTHVRRPLVEVSVIISSVYKNFSAPTVTIALQGQFNYNDFEWIIGQLSDYNYSTSPLFGFQRDMKVNLR